MSSWLSRLKEGLSKTAQNLTSGITQLVTHRKLDDAALEELEEMLIAADMGPVTASRITEKLRESRYESDISEEEIKSILAGHIAEILAPVAQKLEVGEHRPHVVLVVGVNGNGKTTTVAKLANYYQAQGKKVMLAAADTFRAAATEQLNVWAGRLGCEIVTGKTEADPASVAYEAVEKAQNEGVDVLLVDTAGRLHNKANLMAELEKIIRVIRKRDETAPHTVLQVLDGTTGQNAIAQLEAFKSIVPVSALVVTKLDGTAKAGVVVQIAEKFKLPILAIGVGEGIEDLQPFEPNMFARSLVGE